MYKPKYFNIKELVNPTLLNQIGIETAWKILDENLLRCADKIREKYGAVTINGGQLKDCGLRDWTSTTGAKYSAHKFGRALDLHIMAIEKLNLSKIEKTKMYNKIRAELMIDKQFDCLNFEDNITWLHIDTFNRPKRVFNP
ncbi:MAG: hypothetical protein J6S67_23210 [Methanobrevibacter sp.]|nr:hypothetical protein [Methanobrevibacter sp.]